MTSALQQVFLATVLKEAAGSEALIPEGESEKGIRQSNVLHAPRITGLPGAGSVMRCPSVAANWRHVCVPRKVGTPD